MSTRIILASLSPRRRELLAVLGLPFDVVGSNVDEAEIEGSGLPPAEIVSRLALHKAMAVAETTEGNALVIGADTTVALDGRIFSKPVDAADAGRMLRTLSGRIHQVYTGICVVPVVDGRPQEPAVDCVSTGVTFSEIPDDVIDAYIATGEPLDKAGAYGIQGKSLAFIPRIDGDYFNVVGLPLNRLVALLGRFGISIWERRQYEGDMRPQLSGKDMAQLADY
ncbi:MAG: Maf family protein [Capsulimonadaceae bacterium]